MLWHSEQKLSALQRWILIRAYAEIVGSGSNEPKKFRRTGLPPVHLLRIKVLTNPPNHFRRKHLSNLDSPKR
jgi:hypothetical protein